MWEHYEGMLVLNQQSFCLISKLTDFPTDLDLLDVFSIFVLAADTWYLDELYVGSVTPVGIRLPGDE